ncbi:Flagellar WD repeat-containing protein Pf20 [Diplonema papillatum]|nr:Flagellar WD repeat-containing protein Pf20 [Diplonema papillatum]
MATIEEDLPVMEDDVLDDIDDLDIGDDWDKEVEDEAEFGEESLEQALKTMLLQKEKEALPQVRPTITKQPEVIDDFIRNFLVNKGLTQTLETFETEWYDMKARVEASGAEADWDALVPDTYLHNSQLIEQVRLRTDELTAARSMLEELKGKYEILRKQKSYHKLSHNRVVQEKQKLQKDLRRLQQHNTAMEPLLTELRLKNESVMKERMLIRLDRDKLQAKVKTLEDVVQKHESGREATLTQTQTPKKKKAAGAVWPADDRDPPPGSINNIPPPSNLSGLAPRTTLKGHSMTVTAVCVHPTKPVIATASDDKTWKVWSLPGGELVMSGDGHKDWVSGVAFNNAATRVATSSGDGVVKVWDIMRASCALTLTDHTQGVWDVAWHEHDEFLASCSLDHTARIWDVTVGKLRQTLRGHVDSVNSVQFQPWSNTLVTAAGDKTVSLWDPRSGFCVHTFYGHSNAVNQATFSPAGDKLASVDADGTVIAWDTRMVSELAKESCGPHPANACVFDKSGSNIAIGSDDAAVYVYDYENRKISSLRGHDDSVQAVAFASDNSYMITASADATARYWA